MVVEISKIVDFALVRCFFEFRFAINVIKKWNYLRKITVHGVTYGRDLCVFRRRRRRRLCGILWPDMTSRRWTGIGYIIWVVVAYCCRSSNRGDFMVCWTSTNTAIDAIKLQWLRLM